jgi:hypothetical protein
MQGKLGLRAPFDVIATDATLVRGSHGRIPTDDKTRPVLITSWPRASAAATPMQNVKSILIDRLAAD